jgi:hypothetical protein
VLDASHAILLQNAKILDWRHVTYALIKKRKTDVIGMRQGGERGGREGAAGGAAAGFAGRPFGSIQDLVKFTEMQSPLKGFHAVVKNCQCEASLVNSKET